MGLCVLVYKRKENNWLRAICSRNLTSCCKRSIACCLTVLLLMAVFAKTLLPLVGGHLVAFTFFAARHKGNFFWLILLFHPWPGQVAGFNGSPGYCFGVFPRRRRMAFSTSFFTNGSVSFCTYASSCLMADAVSPMAWNCSARLRCKP